MDSDDKTKNIIDQIIIEYKEKSKSFERLFLIFLPFSIFFFLIPFSQYVFLLIEEKNIQNKIIDISNKIDGLNRNITIIQTNISNTNNDIETTKKNINQVAKDFMSLYLTYEISGELIRKITESSLSLFNQSSINNTNNNLEKSITLKKWEWKDQDYWKSLFYNFTQLQNLNANITFDILNWTDLSTFSNNYMDYATNERNINEITNFTNKYINNINDNFSCNFYHDKCISDIINNYTIRFENEQTKLDNLNSELGYYKSLYTNESDKLNRSKLVLEKLKQKEEEILAQWKGIDSPIGKLPLLFKDLILIFPILLFVIFLICYWLYIRTAKLRDLLLKYTNIYYKTLNLKEKTNLYPIWLDPYDYKLNIIVKFSIFISPYIIFLISIYMIFYNGVIDLLFLIDNYDQQIYKSIFFVVYIIIVILFTFTILYLIRFIKSRPKF